MGKGSQFFCVENQIKVRISIVNTRDVNFTDSRVGQI